MTGGSGSTHREYGEVDRRPPGHLLVKVVWAAGFFVTKVQTKEVRKQYEQNFIGKRVKE